MSNNGQCHDLNTTMFTFFGIWKCGFGCRCLALVGAFLLHVKTFTSPKHNPLALFYWKGWRMSILTPLLTPFKLPTLNGHWFFLLEILLVGHGDVKFTNFHHAKSLYNQSFPQCGIFFQCDTPPWFMMSWRYAILSTFLSYLDMYNYTKCHFMNASLLSLTNCANLVYMVSLQPFVIHHHLTHWTKIFNFWNWNIGAL
jgi:hypothetical protein